MSFLNTASTYLNPPIPTIPTLQDLDAGNGTKPVEFKVNYKKPFHAAVRCKFTYTPNDEATKIMASSDFSVEIKQPFSRKWILPEDSIWTGGTDSPNQKLVVEDYTITSKECLELINEYGKNYWSTKMGKTQLKMIGAFAAIVTLYAGFVFLVNRKSAADKARLEAAENTEKDTTKTDKVT